MKKGFTGRTQSKVGPLENFEYCLKLQAKEYTRLYTSTLQISIVSPYTHLAGIISIIGIVCHIKKPSGNRVKERPGSVLNTFPCYNGNIHQARENPFIVFYQDPNSSWGPKTIALSSFFGSLQCTGCLGTPVCQKKHGSVQWQGYQPAIACVLYFHIS